MIKEDDDYQRVHDEGGNAVSVIPNQVVSKGKLNKCNS
jgi:hypothetical protein